MLVIQSGMPDSGDVRPSWRCHLRRRIASRLFTRAGLLTGSVTLLGLGILGVSLASWSSERPALFCLYFYLVLLTTGLRICRSVSIGAMPIHVLFVLFGLGTFSLPETLALACTSCLLDRAVGGKQTGGARGMLFHVAVSALAMSAAYAVYHSALVDRIHLDSSLTMVLAASMFFIVRAPLLAAATSLEGGTRFAKIWQETHLHAYPYYVVGPAVAGMFFVPGLGFHWEGMVTVLPMLYLLRRSYSFQLTRLQTEKDHAEQVARLHMQIVEALAVAAEAKDETTHHHLQRVQIYAMELAEELQLGKEETESLRAASLLHDIGKLAVPDHILGKPGKLTPEEFERVKAHSIVGAEILRHVDFPYPVAPLVRAHHERWNGKGYPDGLSGTHIPLAARILAVADCLDALTSDRQYRRALSPEQAIQWLEIGRESGFDPVVVDALKRRYPFMLKKVQQLGEAGGRSIVEAGSPNVAAPGAGYQQSAPARAAAGSGTSERSTPPICAVEQDLLASLELGKDLRDSLSMEESLSVLAERLRSRVPYDSMALYVRENGRLVPRYVRGENRRLFEALHITTGQGLSGWVADHNTPIVNGNPATEPFTPSTLEWPNPLRSALAVPLEASDGMLGVLSLYQQQEDAFTEEHLRILQDVSPNLTAMLQGMLRDREQNPQVTTDYATGLPNAWALLAQLNSELARSSRTGVPFSVVLLSANFSDQAGPANYGDKHLQGLRMLAQVMKAQGRQYDFLARWGPAGFALLMPGLSTGAAGPKRDQLVEAAHQAVQTGMWGAAIRIAAGESSYPDDGTEANTLLEAAERRLSEDRAVVVKPSALPWTTALAT